MKKVFVLLVSLFMAPFLQAAPAFKENVNYEVIRQTSTPKPEVMEFFSYFCPHCYQFEPIMAELRKQLPADVTFKRTPVAFLGKEMGPELQRAYAVADLLKVEDKVTPLFFNLIHAERQPPQNRADVRAVFVKAGVDGKDFDGAIDSFAVNGMVAQYDRNTGSMNIRAVPSTVVNGKYLVKTEGIKSTDEYIALVKFLLNKQD
ncbi:thiol:disulfide interchange protein DsbA/DsbL [Tolumonas lignilytica]|jgi:Protein-disulfide isomerase|uniref:thiol:disulfide interchange protein DsbA/DsbL n=1 Tax=Tolumonas lignilytica TaxID=1283284 RepID=UPI000466EB2E|nr:thiol:disulfide interchange protein DsbA/DsbL [Tolumonas lignilytica]